MKYNLKEIVFDLEVLPHWWCMVYSDPDYNNVNVITSETKDYIKKIRELRYGTIFYGFNVKHYDMRILHAIINGCDTSTIYQLSHAIIYDEEMIYNDYTYWNKFNFSDLYDDWLRGSLKEFESNCGMSIMESDISFDKEFLSEADKQELIVYCKHDVEATCRLFDVRKNYINSKKLLSEMFNIPIDKSLKSTNAKLAAIILNAERRYYAPDDKFVIPKCVEPYIRENLPEDVIDLFSILNYDRKEVFLFDNNIIFGVGGMHSTHGNTIYSKTDDLYVLKKIDVTSYYPNLEMKYNYISRSAKSPEKLEEIYIERKQLKKQAREEFKKNGESDLWRDLNAKQEALKLIINISYGAMKNKDNALFDEYNASSLCYLGQLLLAALSNKLYKSGNIKIIQTNTDGIIVKMLKTDEEKVRKLVSEWEEITRLEMEFDDIKILLQRDVNNYIEVSFNEKSPYELKGKWSNQALEEICLKNLNATITHTALLNYYTKNIPVEDTINECNDLYKFCFTAKTGKKYDKTYHYINEEPRVAYKVNRCVATTNTSYGTIMKHKKENGKDRFDKIAEIPEHCFLVNDTLEMIDHLDREWYINFTKNKIKELKEV